MKKRHKIDIGQFKDFHYRKLVFTSNTTDIKLINNTFAVRNVNVGIPG